MKFIKSLIAAVGLTAFAFTASAQIDYFAASRTLIAMNPTNVLSTAYSNNCVDLHGWIGIVKMDLSSGVDNAAGVVTYTVTTSADRTNWINLANYSIATSTSTILTNNYYATGTPLATNVYNRAGVSTTPTASSAGFATPYINDASATFTNTGSFSATNTGVSTIGWVVQDSLRYVQVIVKSSGTGTNFVVSEVITGRKQQE